MRFGLNDHLKAAMLAALLGACAAAALVSYPARHMKSRYCDSRKQLLKMLFST